MKKQSESEIKTAQLFLANPRWRLNNLYEIVNKQGRQVKFKMNWAQDELYKDCGIAT